jgi:hypothetical protein
VNLAEEELPDRVSTNDRRIMPDDEALRTTVSATEQFDRPRVRNPFPRSGCPCSDSAPGAGGMPSAPGAFEASAHPDPMEIGGGAGI